MNTVGGSGNKVPYYEAHLLASAVFARSPVLIFIISTPAAHSER